MSLLFAWFLNKVVKRFKESCAPINHRLPYHYHKIGQSAVIFMLDSGHVVTQVSKRLGRDSLAQLPIRHYKVKIASYHTPIYPSTREWNEDGYMPIQDGLKYWVSPIFDKYKFKLFSNITSIPKRTLPLTNSKLNEVDGVVYLGDGNLGITGTHRFLNGNPLVAKVNSRTILHSTCKFKMSNFTAIIHRDKHLILYQKIPNINK